MICKAMRDAPEGHAASGTWPTARGSILSFFKVCEVSKLLVGERGFEPPTPWSRTRCSTRLSHSPTYCLIYSFSILQRRSGWRKRAWAETISVLRYAVRAQRRRCRGDPKKFRLRIKLRLFDESHFRGYIGTNRGLSRLTQPSASHSYRR